jgi:hypothetical protein
MSQYECVVLSGLSGSGKTTVGSMFCAETGWIFIDGDWFFRDEKPKVMLTSGEIVSNWDSPEAVNWKDLNESVKQSLTKNNVILAFFMPLMDRLTFPIHKHVMLSMGRDELNLCIGARIRSKNIVTEERAAKDDRVVRELVYPMYKALPVPKDIVVVIVDGKRRSKENILLVLRSIIL